MLHQEALCANSLESSHLLLQRYLTTSRHSELNFGCGKTS